MGEGGDETKKWKWQKAQNKSEREVFEEVEKRATSRGAQAKEKHRP
jgi:hypothetical protein